MKTAVAFESRLGTLPPPAAARVGPLRQQQPHQHDRVDAFVTSAVRRAFGRDPTPAELLAYEKPLNATRHAPTLVASLVKANTYLKQHVYPLLVQSLYKQILERAPTAAESASLMSYFSQVRRSNDPTKTIKQVVRRLVVSAEHTKRFLGDTAAGVRALYKHVLGRDPESESVVESHANGARKNGWNVTIDGFLNSPEYRQQVGLYGVPGAPGLYAPAVQSLYHTLLNQAGPPTTGLLTGESMEIARDGWSQYVDELIKSKAYIQENAAHGFMDELDRTITLATKKSPSKGKKGSQQRRK